MSDLGEMEELIQSFDWSRTPIGAMDTWSPALRTTIDILLRNSFPMLLWWGPEYICIYNDAYRPVLGQKHPWGFGRPVRECWSEIWHILKPLIDTPFRGGPATWMEDIELELDRSGFTEETHFTIGYSPVRDDTASGGIGGVLATVHEISEKVVGERRIVLLRDLGARAIETESAMAACRMAAVTLGGCPKDIPFATLYLTNPEGTAADLAASCHLEDYPGMCPELIGLQADDPAVWPLGAARQSGEMQQVDDLGTKFANVPPGPWASPPTRAVVLPIRSHTPHQFVGFFVVGISSRLRLDQQYRSFLELAAAQIGTAIANAQAYEEERKRAEALAELDRAKTLFFSNVSHEFRTPLTLMLSPLEEIRKDGGLSQEQRNLIDVAHRNSVRLLKLVNSLLDFSRIEAGRITATYEPVDLPELTRDLASNFRSAMEAAGLNLVIDCEPLPDPVWVDREMWEKIVLNLLSNAFKFTFQGSVTVSIAGAGGNAILTIADTGVGIPHDQLDRVFERFHRVEGSPGRSYEGSGIGLALVQELVKLQGGKITLESTQGLGSVFKVSLPFGHSHLPKGHTSPPSLRAGSTTVSPEAFTGEAKTWLASEGLTQQARDREAGTADKGRARVLVADDNSDMREHILRILNSSYEVLPAADGEAALQSARELPPDLILADVMMPRLDGFGLLQHVRADARLRDIPVILLSARAGDEARIEGIAAGADDYITKPFNARELMARVRTHIQMAQFRRDTSSALRESEKRVTEDLRALRRIQQITPHLIGSNDLHARLSEILSAACDVLGADKGNIQLFDRATGVLRIVAHQGFGSRFLNRFLERGSPLVCDIAARKAERMIWEDLSEAPELQGSEDLEILLGDGIRAIQSTPLVGLDGNLLGILNNHFGAPHRAQERDLQLIDVLARMASDFIERWQSDQALRESEEQYRRLFESIDQGFCIIQVLFDREKAVDYRFLLVNPAFERQTGIANAAGRTIREFAPQLEEYWFEIYGRIAVTGEPCRFDSAASQLNRHYEAYAWSVGAPEERNVAVLFNDITQRREAEETLRETQKLESLGVLAGGIAHDFNNLLTGMLGNASLLQESLRGTQDEDIAAQLIEASERMARLTQQMLAYSGKGHFVVEPLSLSHEVTRIASLIHASIPKHVNLRLNLANDLPMIDADAGQIQQVIMNLVINAAEATNPAEGTVEVSTAMQAGRSGGAVVLTVRDNGCGMDAETKARMFDPFFTTKFTGRGLGLSAVLGIVRGHNGSIEVNSLRGRGTTIDIVFPTTLQPAAALSPANAATPKLDPTGTVLVVDDEQVVLRLASTALERQGYRVLTATNGKEALEVFGEHHDEISLVLLDLTMPVMGGADTLRALRRRDPVLPVIASSGYDEREATIHFGSGISALLKKPYSAEALRQKVALVLKAHRPQTEAPAGSL